MSNLLKFGLLGLGSGAVYALLAQGLVLVYRASAVVNFAQGAIGIVGAYAFYSLAPHTGRPLALVAGVSLTAAVGLAVQLGVMRPMAKRRSSPLARVVATLGVLSVLEQAMSIKYGNGGRFYNSIVPSHPWRLSKQIVIGTDRIYLLLIGVAVTAVLWYFYRNTRFGMATTASAENPMASAALGWSPWMIMAINWTAGGALAGFASILIGPLTGLSPDGGSTLVVPALAAAMVGNFGSFPLTLAGGLLIGISESEAAHFFPTWVTAIPFLVIIAIIITRGRALPLRGFWTDRLPRVGTGRVRPPVLALAFLLSIGSLLIFGVNWTYAITTSATVGILYLSVVLVTGYAGQISLAQYAMAGIGALISSRLADAGGFPFLLALLVGVVGAVASGVLVGLPTLRVRGVNLAVVTLGLGLVIELVVLGNPNYTGGPIRGTVLSPPHIGGWNLDPFLHPMAYAIVCVIALVLSGVILTNIRRGSTGRRLLAVRDNERAAASVGVSVFGAKLYAFAVASGMAGLAGVLLAFSNANVNFQQFDFANSISLVEIAVISGIGFAFGGSIAGFVTGGGLLQEIIDHAVHAAQYFLPAVGILLFVQLIVLPDGIAYQVCKSMQQLAGRLVRKPTAITFRRGSDMDKDVRVDPQDLELKNISVVFGAVTALSDVSLTVEAGEIVGLIGPNGAGKTTLIDAASGFIKPAHGEVVMNGRNLSRVPPHRRARLGLVRSWQSLELFEVMTVAENLLAASEDRSLVSYFRDLVRPGAPAATAPLVAAIDVFNLHDVLSEYPADLPYAQRHLVGIARAVSSRASVLLLDEPAAGLDERSTDELLVLLRRLSHEWGVGILLVEHDVPLVMRACDRVVVLDQGSVIADGTPAEIRDDRRVVDAYLGSVPSKSPQKLGAARTRPVVFPPREEVRDGAVMASAEPCSDDAVSRDVGQSAIQAINASAGYGKVPVVEGLNLTVMAGEVVALLGANGAGKTTTLRMLAGVLPLTHGSVKIDGVSTRAPLHRRVRQGVGYVTEERSVFRSLTAGQNLRLGQGSIEAALEVLPQLTGLLNRRAAVLSGGEQQMLSLARTMAAEPKVLLADELSLGLAPLVVARLFEVVRNAADRGLGVLLVEQQARTVLQFCDRAYVLRRGRLVMAVGAQDFAARLDEIEGQYLGARTDNPDQPRTGL